VSKSTDKKKHLRKKCYMTLLKKERNLNRKWKNQNVK